MLFLESCRPFINLVRQGGAGHDHCIAMPTEQGGGCAVDAVVIGRDVS